MTEKEFFQELSNIKGWTWKTQTRRQGGFGPVLESYQALRRGNECPITAVANRVCGEFKFDETNPLPAVEYLGLNIDWAQRVVFVADSVLPKKTEVRETIKWKKLRKKLNKVCQ